MHARIEDETDRAHVAGLDSATTPGRSSRSGNLASGRDERTLSLPFSLNLSPSLSLSLPLSLSPSVSSLCFPVSLSVCLFLSLTHKHTHTRTRSPLTCQRERPSRRALSQAGNASPPPPFPSRLPLTVIPRGSHVLSQEHADTLPRESVSLRLFGIGPPDRRVGRAGSRCSPPGSFQVPGQRLKCSQVRCSDIERALGHKRTREY
jgi:hypothetical protein